MTASLIVQGRRLQPADLQCIRQFRQAHPEWSRRRLSRELARQWQWRSPVGQLKDMAARTLLVKLHERQLIVTCRRDDRRGLIACVGAWKAG